MDKTLVVISSIGLASFIIWWFFGKQKTAQVEAIEREGVQSVQIIAEGGYSPRTVSLRKDVPAKLEFLRKDPSSCLEEVVMPDFGVSQKLPVNKSYEIAINPDKPGTYQYSCGMHMFFGEIIVK